MCICQLVPFAYHFSQLHVLHLPIGKPEFKRSIYVMIFYDCGIAYHKLPRLTHCCSAVAWVLEKIKDKDEHVAIKELMPKMSYSKQHCTHNQISLTKCRSMPWSPGGFPTLHFGCFRVNSVLLAHITNRIESALQLFTIIRPECTVGRKIPQVQGTREFSAIQWNLVLCACIAINTANIILLHENKAVNDGGLLSNGNWKVCYYSFWRDAFLPTKNSLLGWKPLSFTPFHNV